MEQIYVTQQACRSSQFKYILYTHDSTNGQPLTKQQCLMIAHLTLDKMNKLPHKVELVIGMRAMVMMNISTEADLVNGSQGIVEDIILDPKEKLEVLCFDWTSHNTQIHWTASFLLLFFLSLKPLYDTDLV